MKRRIKRRRDQDYRGTRTTVDWSRLVYMARRGQPGARQVLQDAIQEWFPKQFEEARKDALLLKQRNATHRNEFFVGFDGRIARRRFETRKRYITESRANLEATVGRQHQFIEGVGRDPLATPFRIYYTGEAWYTSRPKNQAARKLTASKPPPFTAFVFSTKGRRGTHEPRLSNVLRHPKIPIIYWFRTADEDSEKADIVLLVRGKGSAAWAKKRFDIYNTRWTIVDDATGEGAHVTLEGDDPWIQDARKEGYRNKIKRLDYPPGFTFFARRP